jgi:RimJ/RimL family protein N-acetyltransferase
VLLKNGRELIIRKASKEDAKEILDYLNIVGGESDNLLNGAGGFDMTLEQEEEFIENANGSEASILLLGLIDNRLVCIGNISALTRERVAHIGEVGISVLKEYWGIGIGSCLMNEMISFAKKSGILEILQLGVKVENAQAIALYKKFGFQEIGRFPRFFKIDGQYYDEFIMYLNLF